MSLSLRDHNLKWNYAERFLRLGHELGVYEVPVPDFWRMPTPALELCLKQDGPALVRQAADVLTSGRPYRPEPAIFVMARAIAHGNPATRQAALEHLPGALRSGAHLFQLLAYLEDHGKWDAKLRAALREWYTRRSTTELAHLILRSPQAGSWDHRKVLGIAEPKPPTPEHRALLRWLEDGVLDPELIHEPGLDLISAYQMAQRTDSLTILLALLERWPLLREHLPARWLTYPEVWKAILGAMPLEALVRWLPRMADNDLPRAREAVYELTLERLQAIHATQTKALPPFAALAALGAIQAGCRARDQAPPQAVETALLDIFHRRLHATPRTGGTLVIAVDPAACTALDGLPHAPGLSARAAFAALTLMAAATAQESHVLAFGRTLTPIALARDERLDTLMAKLDAVEAGAPDGTAPIDWALEHGVSADAFLVFSGTRPGKTSGRTWASLLHYRARTALATQWLGLSCSGHPLCPEPPIDFDMMEIYGFDAQVPALLLDRLVQEH